ncbi:hypothetical protein [Pseudomonas sp. TE3786]
MDLAFVGASDLDDRSAHSVRRSQQIARRTVQVRYDPVAFVLHVGGKAYKANEHELQDLSLEFQATSIVIDATTLDFAEIALILYAYQFLQRKPRIGFIYVEPEEYVRRAQENAAVYGAAFDLSGGFGRHQIPPFACMLSAKDKVHLVSFLGFEGGRLTSVLGEDDGQFYRRVTIVFGIPPFQATWDLEAFMANSRLVEVHAPSVKFCGANNPKSAYEALRDAHDGLRGANCNRLAVAPFGTKPMAIGAALYCAKHKQLRVVFDHPLRKKGRSVGVHCVHWYEVDMN